MSNIAIKGATTGTGVFTLESPATNTDRTLTLPDNSGTVVTTGSTGAVSQAMLASGVAGNGPAFSAFNTTTQSLSGGTFTKLLFDTEEFDTNNNFSSSRFTPTVAGYYQISARVRPNATNGEAEVTIFKNGSAFKTGSNVLVSSGNQYGTVISVLVYMNGSTDYVEIYCYVTNACTAAAGSTATYFQGVLVRAA